MQRFLRMAAERQMRNVFQFCSVSLIKSMGYNKGKKKLLDAGDSVSFRY